VHVKGQGARFLKGLDADVGRGVSHEAHAALRPAVLALLGFAGDASGAAGSRAASRSEAL